ncbi:thiamine pyrophosphate protein domain protein TPP-binding [Methanococcus aeolicus Nankai-3]|uniref:Thiamine pyrophosphate protein domain protein TPP-binding n=1 Tax=Methanococcus aeolicus (strain ATCC BAA-1280 / DSM 17508 / OCM 812 / Nankai-3) TaxID=419665 RepID=A6UU79_META3|nr:pyruvate synthase subunit PorB [Methanococcus aeolicus]ABR56051.1 thiamine pyrophosphate protein domain protein TPP-binding [Methanococcus aeolicus Nankai-3]
MKITDIPKEEYLAPGARACAGCPELLALRLALKICGEDTIVVAPTGCMEVITTIYPETAWRVPFIHVAFENAAAVASGIENAMKRKGKKTNIVVFAGDGATADIGFQSLSGAIEREHNILYICTDNEAYANTGKQRSGTTPYGASTTTSPAGKYSIGKPEEKKNMPFIVAAHGAPYIATASIGYPFDFLKKVKKALSIKGFKYLHVHAPCPTGWGFHSKDGIKIAKLAVQSGLWTLYEIENKKFKMNYKNKKIPVKDYLNIQKRFKHLSDIEIEHIQKRTDTSWEELLEHNNKKILI